MRCQIQLYTHNWQGGYSSIFCFQPRPGKDAIVYKKRYKLEKKKIAYAHEGNAIGMPRIVKKDEKKSFSHKKHKRCRILCLNVPNLLQIKKNHYLMAKIAKNYFEDFSILVNVCVLQYYNGFSFPS